MTQARLDNPTKIRPIKREMNVVEEKSQKTNIVTTTTSTKNTNDNNNTQNKPPNQQQHAPKPPKQLETHQNGETTTKSNQVIWSWRSDNGMNIGSNPFLISSFFWVQVGKITIPMFAK